MNRNKFQYAAKQFRAGKISLDEFTDQVLSSEGSASESFEKKTFAIPKRPENAHKGDFGRVLVIGGSTGMAGAPALAGSAALRTGSGLVTVATSSSCMPAVAAHNPCYMTVELHGDEFGRLYSQSASYIRELCQAMDVVALGPGLGRSDELTRLVFELFHNLECPMVVDADALNALADCEDLKGELGIHSWPRILTPHPGEFQRLARCKTDKRAEQILAAQDLAAATKCIIVLKGHQTVITDGHSQSINPTGNPGMATAGSGDVLTGIIASLIGQKIEAFEAAKLGCYLHGLAGDLAAKRLGENSLIATDIIHFLTEATKSISQ